MKHPADGIFALSDSRTDSDVIIVTHGNIQLTSCHSGLINPSPESYVQFKPVLPPEDVFQNIATGATEADVLRFIGKPNRDGFDYRPFVPFFDVKSRKTKAGFYSWFTVLPNSDCLFMDVTVGYKKNDNDDWLVTNLSWNKHSERNLAPPKHKQSKP